MSSGADEREGMERRQLVPPPVLLRVVAVVVLVVLGGLVVVRLLLLLLLLRLCCGSCCAVGLGLAASRGRPVSRLARVRCSEVAAFHGHYSSLAAELQVPSGAGPPTVCLEQKSVHYCYDELLT
uniref:Uncharacterized protein n=1 Tax=Anopheles coluzzii TaxID=1518534 RepID=A0A8W7PSC9_ANOCL